MILVCGGGPAGTMAAVAAARSGAEVLLVEKNGCLGGTLTAGLVGIALDVQNKKTGLIHEFMEALARETAASGAPMYEAQKYILEQMCVSAGVSLLYHASVIGVKTENRRIVSVSAASKSGLETYSPEIVIDATGDGDVAFMAGCGYTVGNAEGATQPMSMVAVISGVAEEEIRPYIAYPDQPFWDCRKRFLALLQQIGAEPSMGCPNISKINDSLFYLSINHEYGFRFDSAADITAATVEARKEIYETVKALRQYGHGFQNITLACTPEMIGVREGRRIKGLYTVTLEDMLEGKKHQDAVCTVTYWVDIHALSKGNNKSFTGGEIEVKPYDIPLRALIPEDCDNLLLAGRSLSGDFFAHASYRVVGNMACVGEAAGKAAARCIKERKNIKELF